VQATAVKEHPLSLSLDTQRQRFFVASDVIYLLVVVFNAVAGGSMCVKFLHGPALALSLFLLAGTVACAMVWLRWMHIKGKTFGRKWLVIAGCLFALMFAVLFPLSLRHLVGVGSDRNDALRVASAALVHGHYLYDARTYRGDPITPLPGAIILATPFYLLGNVSLQNLFWLAMLLWFASKYFRERSTALLFVLVLLGATSSNLDDFMVGGDYLINEVYVAIALYLVLLTHESKRPAIQQLGAEILLGLAIDSRPIYIVVFPLLAAYLWQRSGPKIALRAVLVSGFVAGALSIPFYLYDPAHFGPLHVTHKLDGIPAKYKATIVLPILGFLTSCLGFLVKLSKPRVYLLLGASMSLMLGIPGVMGLFSAGVLTVEGWYSLSWLTTATFFLMLWALWTYEKSGRALRLANQGEAPQA